MKSKIYVHKIVLDQELNFHKDPCKDVRILGIDAHTPIGKRPIYFRFFSFEGFPYQVNIQDILESS